jgi:hypothetical protein
MKILFMSKVVTMWCFVFHFLILSIYVVNTTFANAFSIVVNLELIKPRNNEHYCKDKIMMNNHI